MMEKGVEVSLGEKFTKDLKTTFPSPHPSEPVMNKCDLHSPHPSMIAVYFLSFLEDFDKTKSTADH
jgi:hypothetical protein